jgi:hypothetical protein
MALAHLEFATLAFATGNKTSTLTADLISTIHVVLIL